ncbi:MAG: efflux RND transporter periplasmic adaptor subunit [Marinosulfonomonas sp.]
MQIRTIVAAILIVCAGTSVAFSDTPLVVEMVKAKATPIQQGFQLTGEVVARDTLMASFATSGRIASVEVQEGDKIEPGTVIARMEAIQQEQDLRAAQAGVVTAQADYDQAKEDLDRFEKLFKSGATTRIARDNAADAVAVKEAALAQSQSVLDQSKQSLKDTVLVSPDNGTVLSRFLEPGQVVGTAQPVVEIALGVDYDVKFSVPEILMTGEIIEDPKVYLTALNGSGAAFEGKVREVSPLIDASTGAIDVKIAVENSPDGLNYGDPVRGRIIQQGPAYVTLPYTAMAATKGGPAVWVIDPETMTVSLQNIEIEQYRTGIIIVKSGVPDGTMVVTKGAQLMYAGRAVSAKEVTQ